MGLVFVRVRLSMWDASVQEMIMSSSFTLLLLVLLWPDVIKTNLR